MPIDRLRTDLNSLGRKVFPDWILAANLGLKRVKTITVNRADGSDVDLSRIKKGQLIDLVFGPNICLLKPMTFPKSARHKVGSAVNVFLRQTLPGQGEGMMWRTDRPIQANGNVAINAYVLKASALSRLRSLVSEAGGHVRMARCAEGVDVQPFLDNRASLNKAGRAWLLTSLSAFIAVAGILVWEETQALQQSEARLAQLRQQRADLSMRALELNEQAQQTAGQNGSNQAAFEMLISGAGKTQLLVDLTTVAPEDVWFSELSLQGNEMRLSGMTTGDVVAFVSAIQQQPWVVRATLDGRVNQIELEGVSRFGLVVGLLPPIAGLSE